MQETKKIPLFPTCLIKGISPETVGTAQYSQDSSTISLNISNLPAPNLFSAKDLQYDCYKAWLHNLKTEEIRPLGTLTDSNNDGLYRLNNISLTLEDGFSELTITYEPENSNIPSGEILLIGYLSQSTTHPMERFEPFSSPLPLHKWWKIEEKSGTNSTQENCQFCPYWQRYCWPPNNQDDKFDLPKIIGILSDNDGNLKYLVHGVPGRLSKNNQPDFGRSGYLYWHPYYGMKEKPGAMGYWICYIDPATNKVVTPMGVTITRN